MNSLLLIINAILSLFNQTSKEEKPDLTVKTENTVIAPQQSLIDWTNPSSKITEHFTVKDAIQLHSWNRLATEADGLTDEGKQRLIVLCQKMEEIRKVLGCPINVHCMYRSQKYNKEVVGAIPNDVHAQFMACDFDCGSSHTIEETHGILEPKLEALGIRMERNTPTWVHIDIHPVGNQRYFLA